VYEWYEKKSKQATLNNNNNNKCALFCAAYANIHFSLTTHKSWLAVAKHNAVQTHIPVTAYDRRHSCAARAVGGGGVGSKPAQLWCGGPVCYTESSQATTSRSVAFACLSCRQSSGKLRVQPDALSREDYSRYAHACSDVWYLPPNPGRDTGTGPPCLQQIQVCMDRCLTTARSKFAMMALTNVKYWSIMPAVKQWSNYLCLEFKETWNFVHQFWPDFHKRAEGPPQQQMCTESVCILHAPNKTQRCRTAHSTKQM